MTKYLDTAIEAIVSREILGINQEIPIYRLIDFFSMTVMG
jgi:hypothetical protein